ncbi:MAG: helix-turn-helix transcriptional regulator [Candidatus Omnitrophota bacterium]|jgi:transcriptional regulator with XRE-family HTH domain
MAHAIQIRFSRKIKLLRKTRGLSQQKLAELAELDYKHIQRLESKRPTDAKLTTIEKLANGFKVPAWKLLQFKD